MITVTGARVHNLKDISVTIPHHSLTVITGMSGSGKSSLAFDTIYAEGQRRYIETFSAYARNFLGNMERPDVDAITGLSPVISIEQKTTNKNPRSTVGTQTEIYDFLRLLYARAGEAFSWQTGERMVRYTEERIIAMIREAYMGKRIYILAPLVRNRKGHYRELFEQMRRKGYLYARIDGEITELTEGLKADRYRNHNIEVVVDKMAVREATDEKRLRDTVATAMRQGDGLVMILDKDSGEAKHYSKRLMCPTTGMAYRDPAPNIFSFNSPEGACPRCKGLGFVTEIDTRKVIPDPTLSIHDGAIVPLGKYKNQMIFWQIEAILKENGCTLKTPVSDIPDDTMQEILHGRLQDVRIPKDVIHASSDYFTDYQGVVKYLRTIIDEGLNGGDAAASRSSAAGGKDMIGARRWADQFLNTCPCPECKGQRLSREALSYRLAGKNIAELAAMDIATLRAFCAGLPSQLDDRQRRIAPEILKEITTRLDFLINVGLEYLSLSRPSGTLSGGESQRIRLATQIGSQLVNVLYILDEPSIGLHQRDNDRLIASLKALRDLGNTVIVVEHDRDMMLAADYIIDIGPAAGRRGGEVVFQGTPKEMLRHDTMTSRYLNGTMRVELPPRKATSVACRTGATNDEQADQNEQALAEASPRVPRVSAESPKASAQPRRTGNGKHITLRGARGNNLRGVDVSFPLGTLTVVTGVSGSGKSTLVNGTLQPILSQQFYRSLRRPLPYDSIEGVENIDKIVTVDQTPIGRTPRSNPSTYTGVFSDIRSLFVALPEAKIRGYKPGRFSFNVKGGRCETCGGNGYKTIEMNFLPDVTVPCEACRGKRYNRETLEVRYKGRSIADVLDMTVNQAVEFFENVPSILTKIKTLQDVGLGYIRLGQSSTTLSGGESQRVKLATELAKRDTGRTLYILDEPTTGLHFEDIRILMGVLDRLVSRGNTVIIIEHNLDVIRLADYIIDLGPQGGSGGGRIVATGTPEQVATVTESVTAPYLKKELEA